MRRSRTIYYLHFYCYFCNLLALPIAAPQLSPFYCHWALGFFRFLLLVLFFYFFFLGGLVENLLFALFDLLSWATEGACTLHCLHWALLRGDRGRGAGLRPFSYELLFLCLMAICALLQICR